MIGFKGRVAKTNCSRCETPLTDETKAMEGRAVCKECYKKEILLRKVKLQSKPKELFADKYEGYTHNCRTKIWQKINWEYKACKTRKERGEFLGNRLEEISKDRILMDYIFRETPIMKDQFSLKKKRVYNKKTQ